MKVGDVVKKAPRAVHQNLASWGGHTPGLGIVIEVEPSFPNSNSYRVLWSNDYGTFWTSKDKLEIVSEARRPSNIHPRSVGNSCG